MQTTKHLTALAEKGDLDAWFQIGYRMAFGREYSKARPWKQIFIFWKTHKTKVYWYELAAKAGFAEAQRDLGYSYFYGQGVTKDEKKAVYWYKKAAVMNDEKALYNLGLCYKHGDGVAQSNRWAKYYFDKASKFGHKDAKKQLQSLG